MIGRVLLGLVLLVTSAGAQRFPGEHDVVTLDGAETLSNKTLDGGLATTTHADGANFVQALRHATDCTTITDGLSGEICYEQDADTLYVCETADVCDSAGEWRATGSPGSGDVTAVGAGCLTGACYTDGQATETAATDPLIWEGSTADTSEWRVTVPTDPGVDYTWLQPTCGADCTITFPSATATLMTSLTMNGTGTGTASQTITQGNTLLFAGTEGIETIGVSTDQINIGMSYATTFSTANLDAGKCVFSSTVDARGLICEGTTANDYETALYFPNPTDADKTVYVPLPTTADGNDTTLIGDDLTQTLTKKTISIGGTVSEGTGFLNFAAVASGICAAGEYWMQADTTDTRLEFCDNGTLRNLAGVGAGDIEAVWGCTSGDCSALTAASGDTLDAGNADASKPAQRSATLPGTCAEGNLYQDTDAGGTELYVCTATDTYTKLGIDNPTLGTETQGNYTASVADGSGIDVTGAAGEGQAAVVNLDYTATLAGEPAMNQDECRFSTDGTGGGILCEGAADTVEGLLVWNPTTSDRTLTLPDATDTLVGRDTTDSLTNKTLAPIGGTLGNATVSIVSPATNDDPTEITRQGRVATTDATVTTLMSITLTSGKAYYIEAKVVARRTNGAGQSAGYTIYLCTKNEAGTTTICTGSPDVVASGEDVTAWNATMDIDDGTDTARIRVTGAASSNITWHATVRVMEVGT